MVNALWTFQSLKQLVAEKLGGTKFIAVANREPYIHRYVGGKIQCVFPASGMATALDPIMRATGGTWVAHGSGDADREVVDAHDRIMVPPGEGSYALRRVWLSQDQEEKFYYGLSNEGLWPLCHIAYTRPEFNSANWESYKEVNQLFAETVLQEANGEPAFVFIQDYHFCLLPRMLKQMGGEKIRVAHFWHIPWPNRETFRVFPWKEELLDGLLGNDLLGFHLRYHCQNFLDTCDRMIEAKVDHERFEIMRGGRSTLIRPFPISIDFARHDAQARSPEVESAMQRWRTRLRLDDRLLGVGIERLDYTKGIPDRLLGLEEFLQENPSWRRKVTFLQIAVPSRSHIPRYLQEEKSIQELVEQINWKWGDKHWKPVILLEEHQGQVDMMALHRLAQFFIVSSLHDGMNLVAKEFVASRFDEQGVLILSQFTGAQRELPEALPINPFAIHEYAQAILQAVTMPEKEQQDRMRRMREHLIYHNVYRWAAKILFTLFKLEFPEEDGD